MADSFFQVGKIKSKLEELIPPEVARFIPVYNAFFETMIRYVDPDVSVMKVDMVDALPKGDQVTQVMVWEDGLVTCLSECDGGLLEVANGYGCTDMLVLNEDALDAVGEFLNCSNGMFVSELSKQGTFLELLPPEAEPLEEPLVENAICKMMVKARGRNLFFTVAGLA
ncbi:MAG: hypothetical protein K5891_07370 [Lachnospiraceae bacterium]|nr:hypothetical protein [Lachnospiraceae bacterium]